MTGRGKPGSRAEVEGLRLRMQGLGAPVAVIAAEIARLYGYRARQAYRLAHGWEQREAAERFNALVQAKGSGHAGRDTMTPSRISEFERWPHSTRKPPVYVLGLLAELYCTDVTRLLDDADLAALDALERTTLLGSVDAEHTPSVGTVVTVNAEVDAVPAVRSRRRHRLLERSAMSLEEFMIEAADQSGEAADAAQASNVGSFTVPMLERAVEELTRGYERDAPVPLFRRAVGVRNRAFDLLDGHQRPHQTAQLYSVAGSVCALLAWMSGDFAQHVAALTQADAAWVFAEQAGHDPLRAIVRTTQAKIAYWAGNFTVSAEYAHDGQQYAVGTNAVLLASMEARAHARQGRADDAAMALRHAEQARQLAGEEPTWLFGCSVIGQRCFAAGVYLSLHDPASALAMAEAAEAAYSASPTTSYNSITMTRINAAVAHLQVGDLTGAIDRLAQVAALPIDQRLDTFSQRLNRAAVLLSSACWDNNAQARALREQVAAFRTSSSRRALPG